MIRTAIVGASGYAGGELLRLLLAHPRVEVTQITSETYAGQFAHFVHPNLRGHTDLRFVPLEKLGEADLLFLALPHGQAAKRIDDLAGRAERIVDLSADFRLRDPGEYEQWYGQPHPAPEWLDRFVYGLPELYRPQLAGAHYASGTGCNAIVSLLALWPLYQAGLVRESVIEVKVGSSEGGNKASPASHHPERAGVVRSYAPVGHRHQAELIQELDLDRAQPGLHYSVTSVGIVRGALATCHCLLHEEIAEREVWQLYRQAYGQEPFVRLVRARRGIHRLPEPKHLSGANYCDVGFVADEGRKRLVVVAAIDNLMKGAAGNAVQTMNVMYSWPERTGLEFPGLHPI
ncbi:MAG: N-acetyl-gamma-glutamyl-phosphate reductase [Anaerolineae bacterium]|jgi:N-acetyl-gamma-glutamyl-phosphate/LysW-gamma-L-alpha-aminoadipyl-6-phosphate reductase